MVVYKVLKGICIWVSYELRVTVYNLVQIVIYIWAEKNLCWGSLCKVKCLVYLKHFIFPGKNRQTDQHTVDQLSVMVPWRDKIFRYNRRFKEVLQSLTLSDMALAVYAPEWGWGEDISPDFNFFSDGLNYLFQTVSSITNLYIWLLNKIYGLIAIESTEVFQAGCVFPKKINDTKSSKNEF